MVSKLLAALAVAGLASAAGTNVAKFNAYWGQSGPFDESLRQRCDEGADYISLSFVTSSPENNPTGYPGIGFAAHCWGTAFEVDGVPSNLLNHCGTIIDDLQYCRDKGIKMLLSIGGVWNKDTSDYSLTSEKNGRDFADFLWGAFGPYDASWKGPRPFDKSPTQRSAIDGFDFDLELPQVDGKNFDNKPWIAMADQFRSHSKNVIITGAPQCPTSPQWFAMKDMIQKTQFDALFIQFYNNVGCDLVIGNDPNDPNDDFNYGEWESIIASSEKSKAAKLFVGVPAAASPGNSQDGYVTPKQLEHIICKIAKRPSFGGISIWDMWTGKNNIVDGKSFNQHVQDILSKCGDHTTTTTTTTTTSTTSSTTSTTTTTTTSSSSTTTTTSSSSSIPTSTSTSSTASSTSSSSTTSSLPTSSSSSSTSSVPTSSSSSSSVTSSSSSSSTQATSSSSSSSSGVPTGSSSSSSSVPTGSSSSSSSSVVPTGSSSSSSSVVPTGSSSSSNSAVPTSSGTAVPTSVSSSSVVLTTGPATTLPPVTSAPWSNTTTTSQQMTTSTVFTTTTRTITSCAPTVTNCPARVVTETIALYTTVCPVTQTNQPPKPTATASQPTEEMTTSTVYTTTTYTISKCPPSVTNCPIGHVTTETVSVSTTVCPVTKTNEVPQPTQPAGKPPGGQQPSGSQPGGQQPSGSQPGGQRPSGSKPSETMTTSTLHSTFTVIKTLSVTGPKTTLTVVPQPATTTSIKCPGGPNCPAPVIVGTGTGAPSAPVVKPTTTAPVVTAGASSFAVGLAALIAAQVLLL